MSQAERRDQLTATSWPAPFRSDRRRAPARTGRGALLSAQEALVEEMESDDRDDPIAHGNRAGFVTYTSRHPARVRLVRAVVKQDRQKWVFWGFDVILRLSGLLTKGDKV